MTLQYFWVDTCCIDKPNNAERSKAIDSMFHWYQNAARCYVYLSDVSTARSKEDDQQSEHIRPAFRASRWFIRGWTLQGVQPRVSQVDMAEARHGLPSSFQTEHMRSSSCNSVLGTGIKYTCSSRASFANPSGAGHGPWGHRL